MKVVLAKMPIFPTRNRELDAPSVVSPAIYALAAIAINKGHDVTVADPILWDEGDWRKSFKTWLGQADVVGFSSHTFNWGMTRQAINWLKQVSPGTTVIVGGVHPTHRPLHVLHSCPADFAVQGEGEAPFSALLDAIAGGRHADCALIPGVAYRLAGKTGLNPPPPLPQLRNETHALPAYELLPAQRYTTLAVETSRGCPGSCGFCSIPQKRRWRPYSPGESVTRVRDALERGAANVLTNAVFFSDDCFTADPERAQEVCRQLAKADLNASYALEARVNDLLDDGLRDSLRSLGPRFIQIGVECGYDRGLRRISKGTTVARVRECAALLMHDGLAGASVMSFIIGLPWEDEADCMATLEFAAGLARDTGIGVSTSWWIPIPSRLWDERAAHGIELSEQLFDDAGWMIDPGVIRAYQPHLDDAARHRIEGRIKSFEVLGLPLRRPGQAVLDFATGLR